ncbi:hypothetical protein H5410_029413 [Solanum commersonii]|uniref:Uncharacterized protein n=1 Tax=Solanum commersonii TaxID=4109 RepID=A0A9J5Z4W9_SOLCO|nr:hypothetical protein H5410_029413 [Solanum commersonii]
MATNFRIVAIDDSMATKFSAKLLVRKTTANNNLLGYESLGQRSFWCSLLVLLDSEVRLRILAYKVNKIINWIVNSKRNKKAKNKTFAKPGSLSFLVNKKRLLLTTNKIVQAIECEKGHLLKLIGVQQPVAPQSEANRQYVEEQPLAQPVKEQPLEQPVGELPFEDQLKTFPLK